MSNIIDKSSVVDMFATTAILENTDTLFATNNVVANKLSITETFVNENKPIGIDHSNIVNKYSTTDTLAIAEILVADKSLEDSATPINTNRNTSTDKHIIKEQLQIVDKSASTDTHAVTNTPRVIDKPADGYKIWTLVCSSFDGVHNDRRRRGRHGDRIKLKQPTEPLISQRECQRQRTMKPMKISSFMHHIRLPRKRTKPSQNARKRQK